MILLSELSRRRIRSIQKLIRVGRNEVVVVLRVDKEKGNRNQIINITYTALPSPSSSHHQASLTFVFNSFLLLHLSSVTQVTSTCRSAASHRKISRNARNAS